MVREADHVEEHEPHDYGPRERPGQPDDPFFDRVLLAALVAVEVLLLGLVYSLAGGGL